MSVSATWLMRHKIHKRGWADAGCMVSNPGPLTTRGTSTASPRRYNCISSHCPTSRPGLMSGVRCSEAPPTATLSDRSRRHGPGLSRSVTPDTARAKMGIPSCHRPRSNGVTTGRTLEKIKRPWGAPRGTYGSGLGQIQVGIRGQVGFNAERAQGRLTWGRRVGQMNRGTWVATGYTTRSRAVGGLSRPTGLTGEAAATRMARPDERCC